MKKLLFTAIGLVALAACSVRSDHSQKQAGQYAEPDSVPPVELLTFLRYQKRPRQKLTRRRWKIMNVCSKEKSRAINPTLIVIISPQLLGLYFNPDFILSGACQGSHPNPCQGQTSVRHSVSRYHRQPDKVLRWLRGRHLPTQRNMVSEQTSVQ